MIKRNINPLRKEGHILYKMFNVILLYNFACRKFSKFPFLVVLGSLLQNLELKLQENKMQKSFGHFIGNKWGFLTCFLCKN